MKSSFKISIAAIGLVASVLLSAAVSPAAQKVASIDYIVEETDAPLGQNEFFEEIETIEINNDYELLEIKDEAIRPTEVKKKPAESSQAPSSQAPSSQAPSSQAPSSQAPSSQAPSSQAPSSQAPSSQEPSSQAPSSQAPSSQAPSSQAPSSQAPSSDSGSALPPQVSSQTTSIPVANSNEQGEILKFKSNGISYSLPVKEALKRIVSSEIDNAMHYEAIKAQVVAAHTYIKFYNDQGAIPSLGSKKSYVKGGRIDKAVEEVYNVVMTYNGKAIYSPYHSCAGGRTQSSKEVWGGAKAYLVSVESKYDYLADYYILYKDSYISNKKYSKYLATKTVSAETVKNKMQSKYGVTLPQDPSTWFNIKNLTSGGYVNTVSIGSKTLGGNTVRSLFGLRSANFTVSYSGGKFTFTTKGYGHGVGLSQWGAHFYADKDGWDYQQILTHYFSGIKIAKVA